MIGPWLGAAPVRAQIVEAGDFEMSSQVRVRGLNQPKGLAIHPQSGDLYVAEMGANRIVVIRNNAATPVIQSGWTLLPDYPKWAISSGRPKEKVELGQLQRPGALAFSTNAHLFVAERVPWGRILEFIPDETGKYSTARLVAVPWLSKAYAWEDLKVAEDGRLFVVGNDAEARAGLSFGVVLMRDPKGDWWVVDYGPFMMFSGVCLSRGEDIVVISERPEGGIVWWDAVRRLPIGMGSSLTPQSEVEGVSLLTDGSIVLAQRASTRGKDARLLRLDPTGGSLVKLVEGFDSVGAVLLEPATGHLLVADTQAGVVAECAPRKPLPQGVYLLQRALEGYETATGFTPRSSPQFLRSFFSQVGVGLTEQTQRGTAEGVDEGEGAGGMSVAVSLRDFSSKLPLVAGKVKVLESDRPDEMDPVTEVIFVLLFPGRMVLGGDYATPSLGFFSAKRKSGKVEQTRELFSSMSMDHRSTGAGWTRMGGKASLTIPIVTCSMIKKEEGLEVNLVFLGMGIYDDYYLSLLSGTDERGTLVVDGVRGGRTVYKTSFREIVREGNEVKNLVVAGFDPKEKIGVGWLNIGQWPVGSAVGLGEMEIAAFQGISEDLARLISKKQMEWRVTEAASRTEAEQAARQAAPEPVAAAVPPSVATP